MKTILPEDSLITYPCDFPLKIMGENTPDFLPTISSILHRHDPAFDEKSRLSSRPSSKESYIALTATIHATSRTQLDDLYRELSSHPQVKAVL